MTLRAPLWVFISCDSVCNKDFPCMLFKLAAKTIWFGICQMYTLCQMLCCNLHLGMFSLERGLKPELSIKLLQIRGYIRQSNFLLQFMTKTKDQK